MSDTTIFHNPACGTSRNVLALIRNAGIEPTVVQYLKTPLDGDQLRALVAQLGLPVRAVLRKKGTPFEELGLGNPDLGDDALIDAIVAHPILLERPIVTTALGARLCRPSEAVLDILPQPQQGAFAKEDGEKVVNTQGERLV
ncbi:MAG: arsenate reductase (glutaredoxin) [Rhodoferax sp.]|uniref:arsenate reductase (glutaredoxin) n=1 Tax=Rhodoferax sp. TaxID=50421 RepID=UPI003267DDAD